MPPSPLRCPSSHIEHLAATHGQTELAALLPVSIDGTVAAASPVMLRAARARLATPGLARFMLGLAVSATLAANSGSGLPYGVPGALISGWPAVAFIGCAEMAIGMVRRVRGTVPGTVPKPPAGLNGHGEAAVEKFATELARGEVPGIRRIRREAPRPARATEVRDYLSAVAERGQP